MESGFVSVEGGRLYFERAGKGSAVVFVHAAIADRRMWNREFELYSVQHTVVRYDVRGLGRSPPANASYSDSEDLHTLLTHLKVGPAVLVGCSNGGRIAIDYTLEHPDGVRGLLLVAPGLSGFSPDFDPSGLPVYEQDMARSAPIPAAWAAGHREDALAQLQQYWTSAQTGPNLELVRRMMQENAQEIFTDASARHGHGPTAAGRLGEIRAPMVLLLGDRDEPTMGYIGRGIVARVPGARLIDVPGADHLINLSAPEAFDSALRGLLA
jgi:3-oxoadipate enol-lactonase